MILQADPPKVGTVLRFVAEAEDRCVRGTQTGRSTVLALQVVSPDELFYEILIRQRAERTKFLAVLETVEKQTPVLERQSDGRRLPARDARSSTRERGSSSRSPAVSPILFRR